MLFWAGNLVAVQVLKHGGSEESPEVLSDAAGAWGSHGSSQSAKRVIYQVHPGSNAAKTSAEVRLGSIMAEPQLV
jgi:hypothetical protein